MCEVNVEVFRARMVGGLTLLCAFACVNQLLSLHSSWGAEREPTAQQGAAGCGCGNVKRAGTEDPDPAARYTRGANERTPEAQGAEETLQSPVS